MNQKPLALIVGSLVTFAVSGCSQEHSPAGPRIPRNVLVEADGTGDYPTIQAAINVSQDGDTVRLANGRFSGDGNRDITLGGRSIVIMSDSGDPINCIIDCDGSQADPHRGITFSSGASDGCVLEGIMIEDAYAIGGGAVLCEVGSAPVLRNVVFRVNQVTALACQNASPMVVRCTFRNNLDSAFACNGGSPTLSQCVFTDNHAGYTGGGIFASSSEVTITDCVFIRNTAAFGGGAFYGIDSRVVARDCNFNSNIASYHGGALYLTGTEFGFLNCSFVGNVASGNGGAAWCNSQSIGDFMNCLFAANEGTTGAAIKNTGSAVTMEEVIVTLNRQSQALLCDTLTGPATFALKCSDVYGNDSGDWVGCVEGQLGQDGNISADPLFCDPQMGDFRLQNGSPCAPQGDCGRMGALPVGCGPVGVNRPGFSGDSVPGIFVMQRTTRER